MREGFKSVLPTLYMDERLDKIVNKFVQKILSPYPLTPAIEVVNYLHEATERVVKGIFSKYLGEEVNFEDAIEDLMRYMATDRNFSPSESLRILGDLKKEMNKEMKLNDKESLKMSEIIDEVLYKAFDAYLKCREKIFELRLKEKDRDIEIMRRIIEFSEKGGNE